jgi:small subunit ribosomal protein S20
MPNTKSAARRVRNSARKAERNKAVKNGLKDKQKTLAALIKAGKKDEAAKALSAVVSALGKAAKKGVIPKNRASRKQSRLTLQINKIK